MAPGFLWWFCREDYIDEIEGDLTELYYKDSTRSPASAGVKFFWNVIRSFRIRNLKSFSGMRLYHQHDMLKHAILLSGRNLFRNKGVTLLNVIGLSMGICACVAAFQIIHHEYSVDAFHKDADRIYRLVGRLGTDPKGFVPYALPEAVRAEVTGVDHVAAFINYESAVKIPDGNNYVKTFEQRRFGTDPARIILADQEYFDIFQYDWLAGNPAMALSEPFRVVLSERSVQQYFGSISPVEALGREVVYGDSIITLVSGVVKDWEQPTDLTFTDFISFVTILASPELNHINLAEWNDMWSSSQAFVKISRNADPVAIETQLLALGKQHFREDFQFTPELQRLTDMHFQPEFGDNYATKADRNALYVLSAVAVFLVLIAVVNFINLSTARASTRSKEIGVSKILGSSRSGLIVRCLAETFLIALVSMCLSVFAAPYLLNFFREYIPDGVRFVFDTELIGFLACTLVLILLFAGLYPAIVISSFTPSGILRNQPVKTGRGIAFRKGLIVFQFSISFLFILIVILVNSQISFMRKKELGFSPDNVLSISLPRQTNGNAAIFYERIKGMTDVGDAAIQLFEPMGQSFGMDQLIYKGETLAAAYKMGDENFIPFYKMRLLAGRNFSKSEQPSELVISERLVEALGFTNPSQAIGEHLEWRGKSYPVVGVVADFHQQGLQSQIPPTFITTAPWPRNIAVRLAVNSPSDVASALVALQQEWKALFPEEPFNYRFLDDSIAQFYENERKTATLANVATVIMLLTSMLGLTGLTSFTVLQRSKEISIRKVLGASAIRILTMLSVDYFVPVAVATLIASPVALYFMNQWLQQFAYHVNIAWWIFAAGAAFMVIVIVTTVSILGYQTASSNPVQHLKAD